MKYACLFSFLFLFAPLSPAQTIENGTWNGFMASPANQLMDITLDVQANGRAIVMHWAIGSFDWQHIQLADGRISFSWEAEAGFVMDCILDQQPRGSYQGACKDSRDRLGPMLIAPPGMNIHPDDMDPEIGRNIWGQIKERKEARVKVITLEGNKYDLGGYALFATQTGTGNATVVLESGLGDDHQLWIPLQQAVSEFAKVISYDRAGLGQSDPSPKLRTPAQMALELDQLLRSMAAAPPYILVAHQMGGFVARIYAAQHPEQVAALILIDATHENLGHQLATEDQESWQQYIKQQTAFYRITPAPVHAEFTAYKQILETAYLPGSPALPNAPVYVLTPIGSVENPRWIGETEKGNAVRLALQKSWAEAAEQGKHHTTDTGSYVHSEATETVVDVIREAVNGVKR